MSGLSGAMTTLIYPRHGRYDVDLHNRKEKVGDGCTTKSDNQPDNNNNNKNDKHNNNRNNGSDDDKGNHKHTSYVMNTPGIISEKWSSSQARKTLYAQSKVYNTRRKKPGGMNYSALTKQRIQRVRNVSIARRTLSISRNSRRVLRRVEPERPVLPGYMQERQLRGFHREEVIILQLNGPVTTFGNQMLQLSNKSWIT